MPSLKLQPRLLALGLAVMALGMGVAPTLAATDTTPHAASTVSQPVTLAANVRSIVLSTSITTNDKRDVLATGWVVFVNKGTTPATVVVSSFHRKKGGTLQVHAEKQTVTVRPNSHVSVTTGTHSDGRLGGTYRFGVFAKPSTNLTVESASQTLFALGASMPHAFATRTTALAIGTTRRTIAQLTIEASAAAAPEAVSDRVVLGIGSFNIVGSSKTTSLTLDVYVDSTHVRSTKQTVLAGQRLSVANTSGPPTVDAATSHTFTIKASASSPGLTLIASFVFAAYVPDGAPAAGIDGDQQPVALSAEPVTILATKLDTSAVSDVWMGGWLTVSNASDKQRVVTVQAAMGGESDGPALKVTLMKHGRVTIPFGILCDEEPAGTIALDLLVSASGSGVSWTGDGNLTGLALAP